ncbi:MAG: rhodanese-like domain-containing protein [Acidimicrobiia bacterium]
MTSIDTAAARLHHDRGSSFLEVLPPAAYRAEHIPAATNIPLAELTRERANAELEPGRPVVVYCYDTECDLSSRGAALLEAYGYAEVYDYTGSKTAWLGSGLPVEGTVPGSQRAGGVLRAAMTCPPGTPVAELPAAGPGDVVVVVDDGGHVLGTVRPPVGGATGSALTVAQLAPSSVRPSITVDELAPSMDKSGESYVIVSTLDGVLLGVVERGDLRVDR